MGASDARIGAEAALDLRRFDPIAAPFELVVDAAQKDQGTARPVAAHAVAAAVEPRAWQPGKGIGQETGRGQRRRAQVAASEALAADQQLALGVGWPFAQVLVDDMEPGPTQGLAQRYLFQRTVQVPGLGPPETADHGRLGGSVAVPQARPRRRGQEGAHRFGAGALAADDDRSQRSRLQHFAEAGILQPGVPEAGGKVEYADAAAGDRVEQIGRRPVEGGRIEHQGGAAHQAEPELLDGGVEAERGQLQHAVLAVDAVTGGGGRDEQRQRGARDDDALGPSTRAGGVEQVGGGLARDLAGRELSAVLEGDRQQHATESGQLGAGGRLGHDQVAADLVEDEQMALTGQGGIQRQVGGASPDNGAHGGQGRGRPSGVDRYYGFRADAAVAELLGQTTHPVQPIAIPNRPALAEQSRVIGPLASPVAKGLPGRKGGGGQGLAQFVERARQRGLETQQQAFQRGGQGANPLGGIAIRVVFEEEVDLVGEGVDLPGQRQSAALVGQVDQAHVAGAAVEGAADGIGDPVLEHEAGAEGAKGVVADQTGLGAQDFVVGQVGMV